MLQLQFQFQYYSHNYNTRQIHCHHLQGMVSFPRYCDATGHRHDRSMIVKNLLNQGHSIRNACSRMNRIKKTLYYRQLRRIVTTVLVPLSDRKSQQQQQQQQCSGSGNSSSLTFPNFLDLSYSFSNSGKIIILVMALVVFSYFFLFV